MIFYCSLFGITNTNQVRVNIIKSISSQVFRRGEYQVIQNQINESIIFYDHDAPVLILTKGLFDELYTMVMNVRMYVWSKVLITCVVSRMIEIINK